MSEKQELSFFKEKRKIEDVLEEFGNNTGINIIKGLLEEGFIENKDKYFQLNERGNKVLNRLSGEEILEKDQLKVFLSYSHKDYGIASEIKLFLENFNFSVFLAHTSIEPTRIWIDEIYKNIKECDIFIPLLTEEFKKSNWTDQECGIAYSEDKNFVTISVNGIINPYGFLNKYQTLRFDNSKEGKNRFHEKTKIIEALRINFENHIRKGIIYKLRRPHIDTYKMADFKFNMLKKMQPFNKEEINEIIEASISNNQIHGNGMLKSTLVELIVDYKNYVDKEKMEILSFKINETYEGISKIIILKTGISQEELDKEVEKKKEEFENKISDIYAAEIVAMEKGLNV